jgi:hypothetical protein
MNNYGEEEIQLHVLLISALDGGEWLASRPNSLTFRERVPSTDWIFGWVGLRADLEAIAKRNLPAPARNRTPARRQSLVLSIRILYGTVLIRIVSLDLFSTEYTEWPKSQLTQNILSECSD